MKMRMVLISMFSGLISFLSLNIVCYGITQKDLSGSALSVYTTLQDTVYYEISGKVLDKESKKAVSFANILILDTHIGTVANSDGEFIIKVPSIYRTSGLQISSIGYKTVTLPINKLLEEDNQFFLEPVVYFIEEVEIKKSNPLRILRDAMRHVPSNYGNEPSLLTVFYRETVQNKGKFVSVSEGVFDVYKSGYRKLFDSDRIKISQARKSRYISPKDRVMFKLQGGPYNIFRLDVVKYPGEILSQDVFENYDYEVKGVIPINDRNTYIISFEQKPHAEIPIYEGNIFIDSETRAIAAMEFSMTETGVKKASDFLIIKQPLNMNVSVLSADYKVNYNYIGDKWILNHARAELQFKCSWNRKLFQLNYIIPDPEIFNVVFEMAVTNVNTTNIKKFKFRETAKPGEIFVEVASDFDNPEFWGDLNIIMPEQPIEKVIERLVDRIKLFEK